LPVKRDLSNSFYALMWLVNNALLPAAGATAGQTGDLAGAKGHRGTIERFFNSGGGDIRAAPSIGEVANSELEPGNPPAGPPIEKKSYGLAPRAETFADRPRIDFIGGPLATSR
jgi:hypothetical protein